MGKQLATRPTLLAWFSWMTLKPCSWFDSPPVLIGPDEQVGVLEVLFVLRVKKAQTARSREASEKQEDSKEQVQSSGAGKALVR